MSGGHFSSSIFAMLDIANDIEQAIHNNGRTEKDAYGECLYRDYPPAVIAEFRNAVKALKQAYVYATRVDYLLSGDDSEDSFLARLDEDLHTLVQGSDA